MSTGKKLRRRVASPFAASETTGELSVDMECSPMRYAPMRSPVGRYETPQMTQISTEGGRISGETRQMARS